eukprot:CAMPEP_0202903874 /NCGR_PEP_ID=MMETSP1392-20130828/26847_1 /ASSEMBLY_ACC=CAM_ASM_000868 /TAXON_ID=225041 /ORGANISM="Chlamydomonas chlamydogama, Strain SAG 11-48b" /LENGTH=196 /DNA_ID=CAMNT_0049591233 /DNA_START=277 /DNA_END=863 /DNA_ORIENTATION=-
MAAFPKLSAVLALLLLSSFQCSSAGRMRLLDEGLKLFENVMSLAHHGGSTDFQAIIGPAKCFPAASAAQASQETLSRSDSGLPRALAERASNNVAANLPTNPSSTVAAAAASGSERIVSAEVAVISVGDIPPPPPQGLNPAPPPWQQWQYISPPPPPSTGLNTVPPPTIYNLLPPPPPNGISPPPPPSTTRATSPP